MPPLLTRIALRLLVGGLCAWALWRFLGPVGLALSAGVFGALLARPLVDLAGDLRHAVKARALAGVEGRFVAYRGVPLTVIEDARHHRWVGLDDLRRVLPSLPRTAVLRRLYGDGVAGRPDVRTDVIRADVLLGHLGGSTDPECARVRLWLDRTVVQPAATVRARLGIRDEAPRGDAATTPPA